MLCLTKLLLFGISLLYYYTNLNSPIICCLFPGDIYLSFDIFISLLALYKLFWECNSSEDFETLVILFAILLTIILPSLSNGWLFWSVNHTSMYEDSEINVFKKEKLVGSISNKLPNGLFGTSMYKTYESCR